MAVTGIVAEPIALAPACETKNDFVMQDITVVAEKTIELLRFELSEIESSQFDSVGKSTSASEAQTKTLLSIAKAIQNLEELIARMDATNDASEAFPADIVEFRHKLERKIRDLAGQGRNLQAGP